MICTICGEEMQEEICAGRVWMVCNSCGNWEEPE